MAAKAPDGRLCPCPQQIWHNACCTEGLLRSIHLVGFPANHLVCANPKLPVLWPWQGYWRHHADCICARMWACCSKGAACPAHFQMWQVSQGLCL